MSIQKKGNELVRNVSVPISHSGSLQGRKTSLIKVAAITTLVLTILSIAVLGTLYSQWVGQNIIQPLTDTQVPVWVTVSSCLAMATFTLLLLISHNRAPLEKKADLTELKKEIVKKEEDSEIESKSYEAFQKIEVILASAEKEAAHMQPNTFRVLTHQGEPIGFVVKREKESITISDITTVISDSLPRIDLLVQDNFQEQYQDLISSGLKDFTTQEDRLWIEAGKMLPKTYWVQSSEPNALVAICDEKGHKMAKNLNGQDLEKLQKEGYWDLKKAVVEGDLKLCLESTFEKEAETLALQLQAKQFNLYEFADKGYFALFFRHKNEGPIDKRYVRRLEDLKVFDPSIKRKEYTKIGHVTFGKEEK